VLTVAGGVPIFEGDRVVVGLGIAGTEAILCHEIAAAALA
jgi:uncharacterized protein GlcG (DUF336 family)